MAQVSTAEPDASAGAAPAASEELCALPSAVPPAAPATKASLREHMSQVAHRGVEGAPRTGGRTLAAQLCSSPASRLLGPRLPYRTRA